MGKYRKSGLYLAAVLAMSATPGIAQDCDSRFAASFDHAFTDVPMRLHRVVTVDGAPVIEQDFEFQPPDRLKAQQVVKADNGALSSIQGQGLILPTPEPITLIGLEQYIGGQLANTATPDGSGKSPAYYVMRGFLPRYSFFADSCDAQTISFETDQFAPDSPVLDRKGINAERSRRRNDAAASSGVSPTPPAPVGLATIDEMGRATILRYPHEARYLSGNLSMKVEIEDTITYEPAITVDPPN